MTEEPRRLTMVQRLKAILFGPSACVKAADERLAKAAEKLKGTPIARRAREQLTTEIESGTFAGVSGKK